MPEGGKSRVKGRLEHRLRRDRLIMVFSLLIIIALAWFHLFQMAQEMGGAIEPGHILGPAASPFRPGFLMIFMMWATMSVGMMLPTASPMILMFAAHNEKQQPDRQTFVPTAIVIAGYLVVWLGFSLAATILQGALQTLGLLSPLMGKTNIAASGVILLAAGIYQWTPFKHACLRLCQTPLGFLMTRWRNGMAGAFRMGASHGVYCIGCCWALMLLMFAGGVMNLLWMALLAVLMLAEKMVPPNHWLPRATGAGLVIWGGLMLV